MSIKKTINNKDIIGYAADVDPQYGQTVKTDHNYNVHVRRSGSSAASSQRIGWTVDADSLTIGSATRTVVAYSAPQATIGGESNRGCLHMIVSSSPKSIGTNGAELNRFSFSTLGSTLRLTASLTGYPASSNNNGASRNIGSGESTWQSSSEYIYRFNAVSADITLKGATYFYRAAGGSPRHYDPSAGGKDYAGGVHVWTLNVDSNDINDVKERFITSSAMTTGDGFGAAVCVNTNDYGSYVFVGSPEYDSGSISSSGVVSYYKWSNTSETYQGPTTINYPLGSGTGAHFGTSIDTDGTLCAIGAPGKDTVVVYRQTSNFGFTKKMTLVHPSSSSSASRDFGSNISISGSYLAVGAPKDADSEGGNSGNAAGRVFIYRKNDSDAYTLEHEVAPTASLAVNRNSFYGMSVALDSGYLIVGNGSYGGSNYPGRVYIYKSGSTGWTQDKIIDRPGTNTYTYFGSSVAASNGMMVVSGHGDHSTLDDSGDSTGIANIYDVTEVSTTNNVGRIFRFSAKTVNNLRGNGAGTNIKTIIGD